MLLCQRGDLPCDLPFVLLYQLENLPGVLLCQLGDLVPSEVEVVGLRLGLRLGLWGYGWDYGWGYGCGVTVEIAGRQGS